VGSSVHTSKVTFLRERDTVVPFGRKLVAAQFDPTIAQHWRECLDAPSRIVFLLEAVEWVALPEMLQLCVLARSLERLGKDVTVSYPACGRIAAPLDSKDGPERRQRQCSFLERMGFGEWLVDHGIIVEGREQVFPHYAEEDDPSRARLIPIRQFVSMKDCLGECSAPATRSDLRPLLARIIHDLRRAGGFRGHLLGISAASAIC